MENTKQSALQWINSGKLCIYRGTRVISQEKPCLEFNELYENDLL